MKNIFLITGFVTILFMDCSSQRKLNQERTDSFLRWLLDKQEEKLVSTKPIELSIETLWRMKDDLKFSPKDSAMMKQQIVINNKSIFDSSLTPSKIFLEKIDYNRSLWLRISKPIFFDNGKKLWINVEHFCPDTCGEGFIEVYELDKSGYKLLFKIPTWIS